MRLPPSRASIVLVLAIATGLTASSCAEPTSDTASATTSIPATRAAATGQQSTSTMPPATVPSSTGDGWEIVGTSVQGRPIRIRAVGHGPRRVLFIGGIHGDEPEGAYATAELPGAFDDAGLADGVTLTILEDANPDGRAAGTRGNANGVDVNRNFPASNFDTTNASNGGSPLSQPEARAVYNTIERIDPALVLVAHSWAGRQFINFDGPAREIAERFAASSGLPVQESSAFAPTPGSLGSYFGRDRGTSVLTVEVLKGSDPKKVWEQLRTALLQAIGGR
jgi:murein peptide amidase A